MAKYVNETGLEYLVQQLLAATDQKITVRMVSDLDENSTNQQIAGAKTVYDFVIDAIAQKVHLNFEVVSDLPTTGEPNIIYLIALDGDTYGMNIYSGAQWYDLGSVDVDLSGYWSKADLAALTNLEIQGIIDDAMGV